MSGLINELSAKKNPTKQELKGIIKYLFFQHNFS